MTDQELIDQAIDASGLSARRFAERVMTRDERTIRRWVSGEQEMPEVARRRVLWFLELPVTVRTQLVRILDRE